MNNMHKNIILRNKYNTIYEFCVLVTNNYVFLLLILVTYLKNNDFNTIHAPILNRQYRKGNQFATKWSFIMQIIFMINNIQ